MLSFKSKLMVLIGINAIIYMDANWFRLKFAPVAKIEKIRAQEIQVCRGRCAFYFDKIYDVLIRRTIDVR